MRDSETEMAWIIAVDEVFTQQRDARQIFDMGWHSRDREVEKLKELKMELLDQINQLKAELKPYITGR